MRTDSARAKGAALALFLTALLTLAIVARIGLRASASMTGDGGLGAAGTSGCARAHSPVDRGEATASAPAASPIAADRAAIASPVPVGSATLDPSHGTCILRLTDHELIGVPHYLRVDYSRRQAFNADGSRILLQGGDGSWHLFDAHRGDHLGPVPGLWGVAEPVWDHTEPDVLFHLIEEGALELHRLDLRSGERTVEADLAERLPWPGAAVLTMRGEGAPSVDQRYWAFQVERADRSILGLVVWDRHTDETTVADLDRSDRGRPDHVSMSPSGDFVVVAWPAPTGVRALTRDFETEVQINSADQHSDLARLPNGHDAYVSVDYARDGAALYVVDLHAAFEPAAVGAVPAFQAARTELFSTYLGSTATALHISGVGHDKPGWVVLSTYGRDGPAGWLHDRVFAVELRVGGAVIGLADHQSIASDYFAEPHATVSRDFDRVLFNSNWGAVDPLDVDTYLVHVDPTQF